MATENWSISFHPETFDELEMLSSADSKSILEKIEEKLKVAPVDYGKRLGKELHPLFRLRVGDCRVIYEVIPDTRKVRIYRIGNRRDVYKKASKTLDRRNDMS